MKGNQYHHIQEKEKQEKLHQQYMILQRDWHSHQSNPRNQRRRYSTNSKDMAKALDQLLDSSPREPMSSIQQGILSPPRGGNWKVRTNDLAMDEIYRERLEVIESGRLKGRRLFEGVEGETEMGFEGADKICNGLVQESEVRSVSFCDSDDDDHENEPGGISNVLPVSFQCCSSSSSSPSLCDEYVEGEVMEEEKKVVASVEMRKVSYGGSGNGRKWMVVMGWLAIASIVFAICIVPMRRFGGYGDEHEMILVPT